jgi:hypothetical protein
VHLGWSLVLGTSACGDDGDTATGGGTPTSGATTTAAAGGTASTASGEGGDGASSSSSVWGGAGGAGDGGSPGSGGTSPGDAQTHPVEYAPSTGTILNPERGFYSTANLLSEDDLGWVVENGHTLVYSYVLLDEHRDEPLPEELLEAIDASMALVRDAGM